MDNYYVIYIFKLIDTIVGLRISEEEELIGADIIYHIIENNEIETEINKDDIIYDTEYIPEINEFKIEENKFEKKENEENENEKKRNVIIDIKEV